MSRDKRRDEEEQGKKVADRGDAQADTAADASEPEPPPPTDPGNLPEPPRGPQG